MRLPAGNEVGYTIDRLKKASIYLNENQPSQYSCCQMNHQAKKLESVISSLQNGSARIIYQPPKQDKHNYSGLKGRLSARGCLDGSGRGNRLAFSAFSCFQVDELSSTK